MPCRSILPGVGITPGYRWLGVSPWWGHGVQARSSMMGWRVDATPCSPPPQTPRVQSGPPLCPSRVGAGARVPGSEGGCVCGCLLPVGHAGGALPVITASAAKLQSRAGASLPPSRPPCLSHPPRHRSPNPPGTGPMATASQPAHPRPAASACALACPGGTTAPPAQCQPPCTLQPCRTEPQPPGSVSRKHRGGSGSGQAASPTPSPPCPARATGPEAQESQETHWGPWRGTGVPSPPPHEAYAAARTTLCPPQDGWRLCHCSADGTWAPPAATTTTGVTWMGQGGKDGTCLGTHPAWSPKKSGPAPLPVVTGLWDVVANVASPRFSWCTGDAAALSQGQ